MRDSVLFHAFVLNLCENLGAHDDEWRNGNGGSRESGHKGSVGSIV